MKIVKAIQGAIIIYYGAAIIGTVGKMVADSVKANITAKKAAKMNEIKWHKGEIVVEFVD